MRGKRATQSLSYPIRLPDGVQADALRLLDVSREVSNATVAALWDRLDDFGERETKYAYKQVTAMMSSPAFHGDRQWRCQAEQAGRILRGQAERKKQFTLILPLLEQGMILPKTQKKPASKNRKAIKQALVSLREESSDGGSAVELQSLIEQACIFNGYAHAVCKCGKQLDIDFSKSIFFFYILEADRTAYYFSNDHWHKDGRFGR